MRAHSESRESLDLTRGVELLYAGARELCHVHALDGGTPPGSGRHGIGVIGAQPLVAYQDNEK